VVFLTSVARLRRVGRVASELARLSPLALLVLAACSGCHEKKGEQADASTATSSASATTKASGSASTGADAAIDWASRPVVQGIPGCHVTTKDGNVVEVQPGTLSLAVAKGKALLVSTGKTGAERVLLGPGGAASGAAEPIADALPKGDGVSTLAAALPFGGDLTTLTYAARRPTPSECADGTMVIKVADAGSASRALTTHACRASSLLRSAARGPLGIAFVDGATASDRSAKAGPAAPAIADAVVIEGPTSRPVRLEKVEGASIDSAAVAAGTSSVAAAYVVVRGKTRELHVARFPGGTAPPKIEIVEKENVGTVTAAYEGDTLHVVWSAFVADKNRHVLHWSKWPAGGAPSAPQAIGTGVVSATEPSLAIDRGRFFLAWSQVDEKATIVKAAASKSGLAALPGLANAMSTPGASAREPVVALESDAMFMAWKETAPGSEPRVRAATVKCLE
jgi:hypothetical protein